MGAGGWGTLALMSLLDSLDTVHLLFSFSFCLSFLKKGLLMKYIIVLV